MKEQFDAFFKKNGGKRLWQLTLILAAGVLLMLISNYQAKEDKRTTDAKTAEVLLKEPLSAAENSYQDYERDLELRLEEILSRVDGAGRVKVLLTLKLKGQVELAKDIVHETSQTDGSGGVEGKGSLTERKELRHVIINSGDGKMTPIVIEQSEPKIEGVIIVLDGGGDPKIKAQVTRAASALLNLPVHKIEVLKMNK